MGRTPLEERVAVLEQEVALLKRRLQHEGRQPEPWWERILGAFADDPVFDDAMRLGREYRESLQPTDGGDVPA